MKKKSDNEKLTLSFQQVNQALIALKQMVDKPMQSDRSNIDACIQRFKFTVELFWKLLKRIIESRGGMPTYPKDVLREAFRGQLIHDESVWLRMLQDRNLTSHTYNQDLADAIFERIKTYYPVFHETYEQLKINMPQSLS
jgi:nucleotidyltransferase substrate binding protein (TIGR01987 family)